MVNRQETHVYARVFHTDPWSFVITAESLYQAYQIEDKWVYDGYEVKLVNRMTGRRLR